MKKYIKPLCICIFLFCIYIYVCSYSYVYSVSTDLADSVFRLHVIANSDSAEDQDLKYKVRDNLIEYMNTICSNVSSKDEIIEIVKNHLNDFENVANETIQMNNFDYVATVELGNFQFPTKSYADISFPAGFYDALKVKIGDAKGQNWWCVLYPSLCFIDTTSGFVPEESKENLKNSLAVEEYKIISDDTDLSIKFKFKLIEFFTKNSLLISKNV